MSLLGLDAPDSGSVLRLVRKGLPYRAFERFQRNSNLSFERLIALINVPRRTMTRRKGEGRFLSDESDRLIRASRLYGKTLELFDGNRDAAVEWLTTAQPGLGGNVPADLANTEVGAREVEPCTFDSALVSRIDRRAFLKHWRSYPAPPELQQLGDEWITNATSAVLEVPSAVIETDVNYLFNPRHRDVSAIRTGRPGRFEFDLRLLMP